MNEFKNYVASLPDKAYNVLLLLTDGAINDMPETRSVIVSLSQLPVSIIIIGVGTANFGSMQELDGDGGPLRDTSGNACVRDIVQFVAFNECVKKGNLAEEVLKEVPGQLCSYMELKGIKPQTIV